MVRQFSRIEVKEPGWVPLFNGRDLTGWVLDSGPKDAWQVVNGAVVGRGQGSETRGWLLSERAYADFLLKCQFQLGDDADGGIGFRAEGGEKIGSLPMHLAVKLRSEPIDFRFCVVRHRASSSRHCTD